MNQNDRRFFTKSYRLAQQSVEGFAFWKELLPHLKFLKGKYWQAIVTNEELLRIIITNTKRSFVLTTYILCDNSRNGRRGHNVHQLLSRCAALPGLDIAAEKGLFASSQITRTIRQVKLLRNNLDAHHNASDEWKARFGTLANADFEELISTIYGIVLRCNKAAGLRRVSENSLRKASALYADRLLRALEKQADDKCVGKGYMSVDEFESGNAFM
jgi:hypothetical protein